MTNMATAYDIATKQAKPEHSDSASVVAIENVHKSFGSQKVLNGITLRVSRGETWSCRDAAVRERACC